MAEIPNYRYITVKRNADGDIVVLVGEKNATKYHDDEIWKIGYVKETFAWMQEQNPEIEEWHIGEFATAGEYAKAGNPDGDEDWAFNTWCRVKKKNSSAAPWVFLTTRTLGGAHYTNICASHCANYVRYIEDFSAAVLGPKIDNTKNNNAQGVMSPVTAPADKNEQFKENKMAEIPNDRYITVKRNADGNIVVLVGEKNATTYHGEKIWNIDYVKEVFAWMQVQNPDVEEFHIGAFAAGGEWAKSGNPTAEFGPNAWCRVKLKGKDSSAAPWVFMKSYSSAADCADSCAYACAQNIRSWSGSLRAAVLGAIDKQKTPQKPINPVVVAANNNAQNKR